MSSITHLKSGSVVFNGPDAVNFYRAAVLKVTLQSYARTTALRFPLSPTKALACATEYTGKKYKRGQYTQAAVDVGVWVESMRAALPTRVE